MSLAVIQKTRILKCLSLGLDGFLSDLDFTTLPWFLFGQDLVSFGLDLVSVSFGLDISKVFLPGRTGKRSSTRFYRKFTIRKNNMITRPREEFLGKESKWHMKDLEPILNVLCNYKAGYVLAADELLLLRNWLSESPAHEKLFSDLSNRTGMTWVMGEIEGNARERILGLLIEMEETLPE